MRRTLPGIFSFEYELPTPYNVSETPKSVDLENELPSVLQFEIGPNDIGGTLSVQLQLDHSRVSQIFSPIFLIMYGFRFVYVNPVSEVTVLHGFANQYVKIQQP